MNLVFKKVTLDNFRSFRGRHEFYIQETGLYLVHGSNLVDSKLDTNGVGKSSLFEVFSYVFEGKTSKGLKRLDVTTWGETKCTVAIDFLIDTIFYRVTRKSSSPSQLHIKKGEECKTIPQEEVYNFLNIPKQALYSIVFSQFQPGFFEQKPQQRLDYFCELFDFNVWDTYKDRAKEHSKSLVISLSDLKQNIFSCEGWLKDIIGQREGLLEKQEIWKRRTQEESISKQKVIASLKEEKALFIEEQTLIANELALLKDSINSKQDLLTPVAKEVDSIESEITLKQTEEALCEDRKIRASDDLQRLHSLQQEKICSYCGSGVTGSIIEKQVKEAEKKCKQFEKEFLASGVSLFSFRTKWKVLCKEEEELERALQKEESEAQKLLQRQSEVSKKINYKDSLIREKSNTVDEEDPYKDLLQSTITILRTLPKYMQALEANYKELEYEKDISDYWATIGFHSIKLSLVRSVASSYQVLVNTYLEKLGLINWSIEISMEKELKGGGFKQQFEVLVNSGSNTSLTTPLAAWSGGELQRLKLAGNFALGDLIAFWSNIQSNLLVIDECSEHLSDQGVSDLLALSGEKSEFQTVYIIEHKHFETKGEFTGVVKVVKGMEGSRVEVS